MSKKRPLNLFFWLTLWAGIIIGYGIGIGNKWVFMWSIVGGAIMYIIKDGYE